MNKIKLQNLTPDIYYNTSRDFQFIGRLFDIVLNSVKTNTEIIYNLPLSDNSDEKLIDLMTLTLGFKSRHNYNIKQLAALCSAFTTIIKNKGNIQSIELSIQALLNAEGIKDEFGYSLTDNNTVLNLYIPQSLTDLNLLKDTLIYILPAGMSCNIIKELQVNTKASTNVTTSDKYIIYDNTKTDTNTTSIIPEVSQSGLLNAKAKNTAGLIANTDVYKPIIPPKDKETK